MPKFLAAYLSKTRVGALTKESHAGKLVSEWDKLVAESPNKPELVDMAPAASAFMAVKDEEELVRATDLHVLSKADFGVESCANCFKSHINLAQIPCISET